MATMKTGWFKKLINGISTKVFAISHVKSTYYDYANSVMLDAKLAEMDSTIDGKMNINNYVTCTTAAATAAKTVNRSGFKLVQGAEITVQFSNTNTAENPTLNVSGTGAFPIAYKDLEVPELKARVIYKFVWSNLGGYNLIGEQVTVDEILDGTSDNPLSNSAINFELSYKVGTDGYVTQISKDNDAKYYMETSDEDNPSVQIVTSEDLVMKRTVLWTNPDPTVAIAEPIAATLSNTDYESYDFYMVTYYPNINSEYPTRQVFAPRGMGNGIGVVMRMSDVGVVDDKYSYYERSITYSYTSGQFNIAYCTALLYNGNIQLVSDRLIPHQIIGIKVAAN